MTIRQLVSVMLRCWYIPLGLLVCAALVTVMLARDGGSYSTTTVVSFMRPAGTTLSPTNGTNDASIITFATAVAQEANNGRPPARYATADAPYYGAGIRQGVLIELANSGNQWVSAVSKAEIEIKVVGRTFNWVQSRQRELVNNVVRIAQSQQSAVAVSPQNRIMASTVPLTTQIEHISASRTSQVTASAAMLSAALIIGAWGSIMVDRLFSRRRSAAMAKTLPSLGRLLEGSTS